MIAPNIVIGGIGHVEVQRWGHRGVVRWRVLVGGLWGMVVECDGEMHAIFEKVLDQRFDYCVPAVSF